MNNKKFIGGGFPAIKECIDEKTIITKESREKREFSIRKLLPITQILSKNKTIDSNNSNYINSSFDIVDSIQYEPTYNFLHNASDNEINVNKSFDIDYINSPTLIKKTSRSKKLSRAKKSSRIKKSSRAKKSSRIKNK